MMRGRVRPKPPALRLLAALPLITIGGAVLMGRVGPTCDEDTLKVR